MKELPIPPSLWDELCKFVESRPHGWVRLNLKDGEVLSLTKYEDVRPTEKKDKDGKLAA